MQPNRVDGLAEAYALFGRFPQAAEQELGAKLGEIGRDVLAAQQRDVAKRTGFLETGLSIQLLIEQLRVKVGLLGLSKRSKYFYGRFVEFGRRAQTVLVTRHLKRTVRGNGRNSKRRVSYEGQPYSLRVRAMAARPFVHVDRPEIRAEQRLADYWSKVKAAAGSSS